MNVRPHIRMDLADLVDRDLCLDHQRLLLRHNVQDLVAFSNDPTHRDPELLDDAAVEMVHALAVGLDLDKAVGDDCTIEGRWWRSRLRSKADGSEQGVLFCVILPFEVRQKYIALPAASREAAIAAFPRSWRGIGNGQADDDTQPTGPRDFVLRRDRHCSRLGWHPRTCGAVHGHPGGHRAQSRERGVYAYGQRPRYAYGHP